MEFRRLFEILLYQQAHFPNRKALNYRDAAGRWQALSTAECVALVDRYAAGLLDRDIRKGQRVALLAAHGSPWWHIADFALQKVGAVVVPVHPSLNSEHLIHILDDAGVRHCIVGDEASFQRLEQIRGSVPQLREVYSLEPVEGLRSFEDMLTLPVEHHQATFETYKAAIHEDDVATIIYTSGSTGKPKGVMLSHRNIVSNIHSVRKLVPVNCDKRVLTFLPLNHIFERMVCYLYMAVGASLYYASQANLRDDFRTVRPHYFTAVPRLLEKAHDYLWEEAARSGTLSRALLRWAIRLGKRYQGRRMPITYWWQRNLADLLVYRRWRKLLGGRVEGVVVGAAALQPDLARLFSAARIEVREGYGLTEAAPVVCFNRFEEGGYRFGTVGMPVPDIELRLQETDAPGNFEILVRGPNVMLGYHHMPEETARTIDTHGWLHTGDLGRWVEGRFLQLTGRKSELFKTSSGKFVAPEVVERALLDSPFIAQCMAWGSGRPWVSALIVPNFTLLQEWCRENDVHWTAPAFMVLNPRVEKLFRQQVAKANEQLAPHERVRRFHLLPEEWTVASGEITVSMKLNRKYIADRYARQLEKLYTEKVRPMVRL